MSPTDLYPCCRTMVMRAEGRVITGGHMPRMYPASVRRQIVIRLRSGESVAAIAVDTGICQATLFRGKRQALIDSGVIEGIRRVEADELAAAHRRIAALEAELALTRDACELFNDEAVVPPKRRRAITEGLIARGHSARSACRITGLARSLLQYHRRRPVPDREIRRLIVADTITEIHQRSRGTYGRRRVRAALLADYEMNVNHKLVNSIMTSTDSTGYRAPGGASLICSASILRLIWSTGGSLPPGPTNCGAPTS